MTATDIAPETTEFVAGLYADMSEDEYHADPVPGGSLSSGGARKLLPPSCPALFKYERDHYTPPTKAMNFGSAAHKIVLGRGAELEVIEAEDYKTKAAQDAKKTALAVGKIPLLTGEYLEVCAMADAIRAHPLAAALFDPERGGIPEASLFWEDGRTGIWRRARLDWMPYVGNGGQVHVGDYKTSVTADPDELPRHFARFGYHQQHDWYVEAINAIYPGLDVRFIFVVQEKTPPYLVTVVELVPGDVKAGHDLNQQAIDKYVECTNTGIWPGYAPATQVVKISLPSWSRR